MPCGERHCHRGRLVVCCCCFSPSKLVLSAAPSLLFMNLGHEIVAWQSRPTRATTLWQASCGTVAKADLVATKAKTVCGQARKYGALRQAFSTEAARSSKACAGPPSRTPAFVDLKFFYGTCEHLSVDQKPWDGESTAILRWTEAKTCTNV